MSANEKYKRSYMYIFTFHIFLQVRFVERYYSYNTIFILHLFFACKCVVSYCRYTTIIKTGYSKVKMMKFIMTSQMLNDVKCNVTTQYQGSRQLLFHLYELTFTGYFLFQTMLVFKILQ